MKRPKLIEHVPGNQKCPQTRLRKEWETYGSAAKWSQSGKASEPRAESTHRTAESISHLRYMFTENKYEVKCVMACSFYEI